jgi:hypothetical protein
MYHAAAWPNEELLVASPTILPSKKDVKSFAGLIMKSLLPAREKSDKVIAITRPRRNE